MSLGFLGLGAYGLGFRVIRVIGALSRPEYILYRYKEPWDTGIFVPSWHEDARCEIGAEAKEGVFNCCCLPGLRSI